MRLILLVTVTLAIASASSAFAETLQWRSPKYPVSVEVDKAIWLVPDTSKFKDPSMIFGATRSDKLASILVQAKPIPAGQKLPQILETFATGFAKGAARKGANNTIEWIRKDLEKGDCEFVTKYAEPKPGSFFIGRLVVAQGNVFIVIAFGDKSTAEAEESARGLMRQIRFE